MPRRGVSLKLGISQILVVIALIVTILDLLPVGLGALPLLHLAIILLCLAWLVP